MPNARPLASYASAPIGRREAVWRMSALVGGALVAPAVLAGCERGAPAAAGAGRAAAAWAPRALTAAQAQTVAAIGEVIIPATTTPGARAAQVERFVDNMVGGFMPKRQRERFLAGLARVDARSQRAYGAPFLAATAEQQRALVVALNAAAYAGPPVSESRPADQGFGEGGGGRRGRGRQPAPQEGEEVSAGRAEGGGAAAKAATDGPGGAWEPDDVGRDSFFLNLKRLVIEGYYTSEVGATQELRVNPMGAWRADIPYPGRAWA